MKSKSGMKRRADDALLGILLVITIIILIISIISDFNQPPPQQSFDDVWGEVIVIPSMVPPTPIGQ